MLDFLTNIFGNENESELKRIRAIVKKINAKEVEYSASLGDDDIYKKTQEFKERIKNGETVDDLLVEAFALVKCACKKICGDSWNVMGHDIEWNIVPFDVQLIGGIVLHEGKLAEMRTGEGKTFVATLPMYLNALTGKPCFVVTVNEYLAERDSQWMGGLFNYLGLTVGVIKNANNTLEKKSAYACDIVYGTNSEFGFDYLRDNMATDEREIVQRDLYFAIVDEVDSILIDEARTPLIISAPDNKPLEKYKEYAALVKALDEQSHYTVDEKSKAASLTEEGINFIEKKLGITNIYDENNFSDMHVIEQALKARALFKRDQNYVVRDGQVMIVDEFTGRLMNGRRYSEGLHQAIEAKEGVEIKRESRTLATITLQNYFRMFKKLAGMTGTAVTEKEEFRAIYNLDVLVIPTHHPIARNDLPDGIYRSKAGKYEAVVAKIKELHEKGQPVLVGTINIDQSELISGKLQKIGVPHKVLNAKHHEKEAEIIALAGQKGAVTIATNMAGRGTDIKLAPDVVELGGLYVIGTERHESRRIDNQLRGRSGRQGDPGCSQFYISVEDDLMRLFGGDKVKAVMDRLGVPEDMPIENKYISRSIENAQKKVEGHNFDIRKHLVEYDNVMNRHRDIIYRRRRDFLSKSDMKNEVLVMIEREVERIVMEHCVGNDVHHYHFDNVLQDILALYHDPVAPLSPEHLHNYDDRESLMEFLKKYLWEQYQRKEADLPTPDILRNIEKSLGLKLIDVYWMDHIDAMTHLREKVAFAGYAQKNPLLEYKNEAFTMFEKLLLQIERSTVQHLFKLKIELKPTEPMQKNDQLAVATEHHPTLVKEDSTALTVESETELSIAPKNELAVSSKPALAVNQKKEITVPKKTALASSTAKSITAPDAKYLPKKKRK